MLQVQDFPYICYRDIYKYTIMQAKMSCDYQPNLYSLPKDQSTNQKTHNLVKEVLCTKSIKLQNTIPIVHLHKTVIAFSHKHNQLLVKYKRRTESMRLISMHAQLVIEIICGIQLRQSHALQDEFRLQGYNDCKFTSCLQFYTPKSKAVGCYIYTAKSIVVGPINITELLKRKKLPYQQMNIFIMQLKHVLQQAKYN